MSDFFLRPFKASDLDVMIEQVANAAERPFFKGTGVALHAEEMGAFTGELEGRPVVCGGVIPYWPGRGQIWTMFDEECKPNFVPVFRGIQQYLSDQLKIYHRIEVCIPSDFKTGRRRAELLGFKLEVDRARKYLPDGRDAALYALVREGA